MDFRNFSHSIGKSSGEIVVPENNQMQPDDDKNQFLEDISKLLQGFMALFAKEHEHHVLTKEHWIHISEEFTQKLLRIIAWEKIRDAVLVYLAAQDGSMAAKQALVKNINAICRASGNTIVHPDTNEPCMLVAVRDWFGGKFLLEDRKTKKRSLTTKDIMKLFPFKLATLKSD